jgi:uncharacterized coiled-coil DUF342 family protein
MSDIVEELREHIMLNFTTDARDEIVEAVSEIERLRAERDELRRQLECHTIIIDGMRELREDAERYQWLLHDHDDAAIRVKCRAILQRLPSMSYSAASTAIDAARKA